MWNNFYYNTGTGSGDVTINVHGPVYAVKYLGESDKRVYYRKPQEQKVRYIGQPLQKVTYKQNRTLKLRYQPEAKIKIRLICP